MERMEHSDPPPPMSVTGMTRLESQFEAAKSTLKRLDRKISSSTFGRIFRLQGSGHVGSSPISGEACSY